MGSSSSRQITLDNCQTEKNERDSWKSKYNSMRGSKQYWTRRSLKAEKDLATYVANYKAAMAKMRSWRSKYNSTYSKYENLLAETREIRLELDKARNAYNKIDERMSNSKSAKEAAKQLFDSLQARYLDRLELLSTQEDLLFNQNSRLSNSAKKIKEDNKTVAVFEDKIQTGKRNVQHDLEFNKSKGKLYFTVKLIFLILALIVIGLTIKKLIKGEA